MKCMRLGESTARRNFESPQFMSNHLTLIMRLRIMDVLFKLITDNPTRDALCNVDRDVTIGVQYSIKST